MLPGVGMDEMIVIVVLILILFGSDRLPDLARGLGKGMRELKKATDEVKKELEVAGYDILAIDEASLDYQYIIKAQRK